MKVGDSVVIDYPATSYHRKAGTIVTTVTDDFLGLLYVIKLRDFTVALTAKQLRPAPDGPSAALRPHRKGRTDPASRHGDAAGQGAQGSGRARRGRRTGRALPTETPGLG